MNIKNKKIAILTSGGDAASMNKVLSTFVIYGLKNNLELYFVYEGYKGLYQNKIKKAKLEDIREIHNRPGTIIKSSRFPELADVENQKKCAENLKKNGIYALIVCGGNGSYIGASKLKNFGIDVMCIPGTIDNDIASTELTIGFDTSLNTIIKNVNQIKASLESHNQIALVEIMGRDCPDLTIYAAVSCEADYIITKDNVLDKDQFCQLIKTLRKTNKNSILILVTEKIYGRNGLPTIHELASYGSSKLKEKIKVNILGYLQRGATPTGIDLYIASLLTVSALDLYLSGEKNFAVGMKNFKVWTTPIDKAIKMKNTSKYDIINKLIINFKK